MKLPVNKIYYDKEFNCRGSFTPQSCLDLAQSIEQIGLQFPVLVQPRDDVPTIPDCYDYRLIVGHRRFTAVTLLLHWSEIEAEIRSGLSEREARTLNLVENLERKNITLLDEAKAIRNIFPKGTTIREISKTLSKSTDWCRVRLVLLTLPEEVQQDCAAGRLGAYDIHAIISTKKEEQIALAREIKLAKIRGESTRQVIRKLKKNRVSKGRKEIHNMLSYLMVNQIEASPFRALAWAAGDIATEDFLNEPNENFFRKET